MDIAVQRCSDEVKQRQNLRYQLQCFLTFKKTYFLSVKNILKPDSTQIILYGKSPEKYGFVLGVTMGRVLVLIQVRRALPVADKHTSRHKQPNKTFQTNQKIKERKIRRSAEPPADPLGRSPRFSVPIPFRLLLNACLLAGKRFLFPSVLFRCSFLVFLPTWLFYF